MCYRIGVLGFYFVLSYQRVDQVSFGGPWHCFGASWVSCPGIDPNCTVLEMPVAVLVVFCKLEVPEPVAGKEQLHVLKNELVDLQYKTV